jgi:hypothetical protein
MTDAETILRSAESILVIDWPTEELPETLARAGYVVVVKGGPGSDDYVEYVAIGDGSVRLRPLGRPDKIDVVHVYRPLEELPGFVDLAVELGATTVWILSGLASAGTRDPLGSWLPSDQSAEARRMVESAGLAYIDRPAILEAIRTAGIEGERR